MSRISEKYENLTAKIDTLCEEHELLWKWNTDGLIYLKISPAPVSNEQTSFMQDDEDNSKSSSDAEICYIFKDGTITISTKGKLFITEALMNKFKNMAKKLHYLYLQLYHEERMQEEQA